MKTGTRKTDWWEKAGADNDKRAAKICTKKDNKILEEREVKQ